MIAKTTLNFQAILVGCLLSSSVSLAKPAGYAATTTAPVISVAIATSTVSAERAVKTVCVIGTAPSRTASYSGPWGTPTLSPKVFTVHGSTSGYHLTTMSVVVPDPTVTRPTAVTVTMSTAPYYTDVPIEMLTEGHTLAVLWPSQNPSSYDLWPSTRSYDGAVTIPGSSSGSQSFVGPPTSTVLSTSPTFTVHPVSTLIASSSSFIGHPVSAHPASSSSRGPQTVIYQDPRYPDILGDGTPITRTTIGHDPTAGFIPIPTPSVALPDGTWCDYVEIEGKIVTVPNATPTASTSAAAQQLNADTNGAISNGVKLSVVSSIAGGVFGVIAGLL